MPRIILERLNLTLSDHIPPAHLFRPSISCNSPEILTAAEHSMTRLLALEGTKGMDIDRLFRKVQNDILKLNCRFVLKSFTTLRENGPFDLQGSCVVYVPQRDKNITRTALLSDCFLGSEHGFSVTTGLGHDAAVLPSTLTPCGNTPVSAGSPLFTSDSDDECSLQSFQEDTLPYTNDMEPNMTDTRASCLWDTLAWTVVAAIEGSYPLDGLIREIVEEGHYTSVEIIKALADGPFHVSAHAEVSYLPEEDSHHGFQVRRLQYDLLKEDILQERLFPAA